METRKIIKFGDTLKRLRLKKGLTQEEVAKKINIPRTTYANYETNKRSPKLDILKNICTILDTDISALLLDITIHTATLKNADLNHQLNDFAQEIIKNKIYELSQKNNGSSFLKILDDLNEDGLEKAMLYIKDLSEIPKYQRKKSKDK